MPAARHRLAASRRPSPARARRRCGGRDAAAARAPSTAGTSAPLRSRRAAGRSPRLSRVTAASSTAASSGAETVDAEATDRCRCSRRSVATRRTSSGRCPHASIDRLEHLPERRHPPARPVGEVGAGEERVAVVVEHHGHRPAAVAGHRRGRLHVDRVDVGPLLAVDLDADEVLVEVRRRCLVLERLVGHHVAPVAGGVPDAQQYRHAPLAGLDERLRHPTPTSRPGCRRAGGGRARWPSRAGWACPHRAPRHELRGQPPPPGWMTPLAVNVYAAYWVTSSVGSS